MMFLLLLLLIGFAYVVVNVGSRTKMSLRAIAVPLVLVAWLMQVGAQMHLFQ